MFERIIHRKLTEAIEKLSTKKGARYPVLERYLALPGRDADEISKLAEAFLGNAKPKVMHSYAREGAEMPLFSIVLGEETAADQYLGDVPPPTDPATVALVEKIETKEGRTVDAAVDRLGLTFHIFIYSENPDVTLAYYGIVSQAMRSAKREFMKAGMENITFSGRELAPDARYIPANLYVRQFTISCFSHLLYAYDLDLGPLATGRGKYLTQIHVDTQVTGVEHPGVSAFTAETDEE